MNTDDEIAQKPKFSKVSIKFTARVSQDGGLFELRLAQWTTTQKVGARGMEARQEQLPDHRLNEQNTWHRQRWALLLYFVEIARRAEKGTTWDDGPILTGGSGTPAMDLINYLQPNGYGNQGLGIFFPEDASAVLLNGGSKKSPVTGLFRSARVVRRGKGSEAKLFLNLEMLQPQNVHIELNGRTADAREKDGIHAELAGKARRTGPKGAIESSTSPVQKRKRGLAPNLAKSVGGVSEAWTTICNAWARQDPKGFPKAGADAVRHSIANGEVFPKSHALLMALAQNEEALAHVADHDCHVYRMRYTSLRDGLSDEQLDLSNYIAKSWPGHSERRVVKRHDAHTSACLSPSNAPGKQRIFAFPTFDLASRHHLGVIPYGALTQIAWLMHSDHPAVPAYRYWLKPRRVIYVPARRQAYFRAVAAPPTTAHLRTARAMSQPESYTEASRGWIALCLHAVDRHRGKLYVEDGSYQGPTIRALLSEASSSTRGGFDLLCRQALEVVESRKESVSSDLFSPASSAEMLRHWIDSKVGAQRSPEAATSPGLRPIRPGFVMAFDSTMAVNCMAKIPDNYSVLATPLPEKHHVPVGLGFSLATLPHLLIDGTGKLFHREAVRILGQEETNETGVSSGLRHDLEALGLRVHRSSVDADEIPAHFGAAIGGESLASRPK